MTKPSRPTLESLLNRGLISEALDALENDHDYLTKGGVFPERLIDVWVSRKRAELKKLEQIPNPAEFKMYYDL